MSDRTRPSPTGPPRVLIERFPSPGRRVEQAYHELDVALYGSEEQKKALGSPRRLARPWDPPTCVDPGLRAGLWTWLDRVVTWLNREYVWDVTGMVPACWPKHPHLVHELAVLADLRRKAGHALSADGLEEWHRYALPAFHDRMRQRMRAHCEDRDHQPWPAQGRHTRHSSQASAGERAEAFERDVATLMEVAQPMPGPPALFVVGDLRVDPVTGEVLD